MALVLYRPANPLTGQNLNAEAQIGATYTAAADGRVQVSVNLSNLNNSATTVTFRAVKYTAGGTLIGTKDLQVTSKNAATDTVCGSRLLTVMMRSGEQLKIFAQSLNPTSPDTSVTVDMDIVDAEYVVASNMVAAAPSAADNATAAATAILATPAHKVATDSSGRVTAENMVSLSALPTKAEMDAQFTATAALIANRAGGIVYPFLVTDADDTPISGVEVLVTSDAGGAVALVSGRTNALGAVDPPFYLPAGVAYFWLSKAGWNFVNPNVQEVSE